MYCPFCGANCREGAKFCSNCGSKLTGSEAPAPKKNIDYSNVGTSQSMNLSRPGNIEKTPNAAKKQENFITGIKLIPKQYSTSPYKEGRFFTAPTFLCRYCGDEYQTDKESYFKNFLCPTCMKYKRSEGRPVIGYIDYSIASYLGTQGMSREEYFDKVYNHRNKILEKYSWNNISRKEILKVSDNYKNLSAEEAENFLKKIDMTSYDQYGSNVVGHGFIMPGAYEGAVIDLEDVTAVGVKDAGSGEISSLKLFSKSTHFIVVFAIVISSDPFMPVVGLYFKFPFGSSMNEYLNTVADIFASRCPNLVCPVAEIHDIYNWLHVYNIIPENINPQFAFTMVDQALNINYSSDFDFYDPSETDIDDMDDDDDDLSELEMDFFWEDEFENDFNYHKLDKGSNISGTTRKLLSDYGFLSREEIDSLLYDRPDKKLFWDELRQYANHNSQDKKG